MPQFACLAVLPLILGGCASSGTFAPLSETQTAAIREECGVVPISLVKSHAPVSRRAYSACKSDVLARLDEEENG